MGPFSGLAQSAFSTRRTSLSSLSPSALAGDLKLSRSTLLVRGALALRRERAKLDELKRIDGTLRARILSRRRSMMGR